MLPDSLYYYTICLLLSGIISDNDFRILGSDMLLDSLPCHLDTEVRRSQAQTNSTYLRLSEPIAGSSWANSLYYKCLSVSRDFFNNGAKLWRCQLHESWRGTCVQTSRNWLHAGQSSELIEPKTVIDPVPEEIDFGLGSPPWFPRRSIRVVEATLILTPKRNADIVCSNSHASGSPAIPRQPGSRLFSFAIPNCEFESLLFARHFPLDSIRTNVLLLTNDSLPTSK